MNTVTLHQGDNRPTLRRLITQGVRVHSVVTDPPYYLESVVKRFGKPGAAAAQHGTDGLYARQSKGFMGKAWDGAEDDGTRIAFDPEFWALIWEILLPGGYVLAFSSPRTGHHQAVAMEAAGFIMHPFIGWTYGQGFPKAHDASKAIDRQLGTTAGRETVRELYTAKRIQPGATNHAEGGYGKQDVSFTATESRGGSPESQDWDGWSYGAQAMKPALEPIYVGQKPFSEKNGALNLLKHGVGAMNIDGCRVATDETLGGGAYAANGSDRPDGDESWRMHRGGAGEFVQPAGRWPANLIHDGSDDVVAMFPESVGQIASSSSSETRKNQNTYGEMKRGHVETPPRGDSGSAARFFNAFPVDEADELWVCDLDAQPIIYAAKASRVDRVIQCTACGLRHQGKPTCGCLDDDGKAAKTSSHPTVKPIAMMRWLCRLVTPPGGVVLDPFAGSGTTGRAALDEGFSAILMEQDPDYAADIRFRLGLGSPLPREILDLLDGPVTQSTELETDLIG